MLVLSRFKTEGRDDPMKRIRITLPDGVNIFVDILEVRGDKVRVGVTAPLQIRVDREEIALRRSQQETRAG